MAGKITTVLVKKEAEVYCSQGLHREAITLYTKLLATSPNMAPPFRNAIQCRLQEIKAELQGVYADECSRHSVAEILRIKQGWGPDADESDLLVCAQAFCQIGHYRYALAELAKLLRKGCEMSRIAAMFAECLVHILRPQKLAQAVDGLLKKAIRHPEQRLTFKLLLAEQMAALEHTGHALALYRPLRRNSFLLGRTPRRLAAIARKIQAQAKSPTGNKR